jgi:hypothetical protein
MKALQIIMQSGGTAIQPLPFTSPYRKGDVPAEFYRRQASGEVPLVDQNLKPARFFREIRVTNGEFFGLASGPGALLTVIITGELTLKTSNGQTERLVPGDMFLINAESIAHTGIITQNDCRLVQIGVTPDWPGADATLQNPGTLAPRESAGANIKRMYKGAKDLAYFREFPELFVAVPNEWSAPRPVTGFRFLCWEDGFIDWHPEIVNTFAVILSGELEIETSGDRVIETFLAGDICLAEDRTGVGHIDRCRGAMHTLLLVTDDGAVW